jgi:hypothetical protein
MTLTAEVNPREWRTGKATIRLSIPTMVTPMGEVVSTTQGIAFYDNADDGPEVIDIEVIPAGAIIMVRDGDVIGNGAVIAQW